MPDSVPIHIGGQSRELRFDLLAVEAAESLLGREDIQTVTFSKLSTINLHRIAAAGLSTYGDDAKKVSPPQVRDWIAKEPKVLAKLERAVMLAVTLHLQEVGKVSDEDARILGEAVSASARGSAGTKSSDGGVVTTSP